MDENLKKMISAEANAYMAAHGMSQAQFSQFCGVNQSYISNIKNGVFEYNASGGKMARISDKVFMAIAKTLELSLEPSYWNIIPTEQFVLAISALEDAKEGRTRTIIGESGCGKTLAVDQYLKANPVNTYRITVSALHTINDILEDIAEAMDIKLVIGKNQRLKKISATLRDMYLQGMRPLIIIDEAENLKVATIGLCKALYDFIHQFCGLAFVGTPDLEAKLDKMQRCGNDGIVQFRRRIKAGTIRLPNINRKYDEFLADIEDLELCNLLHGLCGNYGELHDFVEPALRSASTEGVPLTAEYFKKKFYISA